MINKMINKKTKHSALGVTHVSIEFPFFHYLFFFGGWRVGGGGILVFCDFFIVRCASRNRRDLK